MSETKTILFTKVFVSMKKDMQVIDDSYYQVNVYTSENKRFAVRYTTKGRRYMIVLADGSLVPYKAKELNALLEDHCTISPKIVKDTKALQDNKKPLFLEPMTKPIYTHSWSNVDSKLPENKQIVSVIIDNPYGNTSMSTAIYIGEEFYDYTEYKANRHHGKEIQNVVRWKAELLLQSVDELAEIPIKPKKPETKIQSHEQMVKIKASKNAVKKALEASYAICGSVNNTPELLEAREVLQRMQRRGIYSFAKLDVEAALRKHSAAFDTACENRMVG